MFQENTLNKNKNIYLVLISVFIFAMYVYLWSLPGTVVLEDDGLFILASYFNGISHPPGYPLYTLLGHLSTWLPIGSIAYRVHLLSAFFGALSCCCIAYIILVLLKDHWIAVMTGMSFSVSRIFWSQSIIAEVYSLNVLIFFILVILVLKYISLSEIQSKQSRLLYLMAFIYGLGLSNHWPLLILSSPMLLVFIWPKWKEIIYKFPVLLLFLFLGLLPYIYMVIRSQMGPEISFYGDINTWDDFWFYVSREGYTSMDNHPTAGWQDKFQFIVFVIKETFTQLGVITIPFIFLGFIYQWKYWSVRLSTGLVLGFIGNTLLLILLLNNDYAIFSKNVFRVYPLIAYAIVTLWIGLGVHVALEKLKQGKFIKFNHKYLKFAFVYLIVITTFMENAADNYRASDTWAEDYARVILDSLESDAILFTAGDLDLGALGYLNKIQNYRSDVELYNVQGLIFSNRLFRTHKLTREQWENLFEEFIEQENRPIYFIEEFTHKKSSAYYGLYFQVSDSMPEDKTIYKNNPEIITYLFNLIKAGPPLDAWEEMHYWKLVSNYCSLVTGLIVFSDVADRPGKIRTIVDESCSSYYGLINVANILLQEDVIDLDYIDSLLDNAEDMKQQANTKGNLASLYNLKADLFLKQKNKSAAVNSYQKSLQIWHHKSNIAIEKLNELLD